MKIVIDGGFGADKVVCNHNIAVQIMALLPHLRPVKQEYDNGYFYTLQGKRAHTVTFTVINDDTVRLPVDLKELVEVKREEAELARGVIEDESLNTEASRTDGKVEDTGEIPF